eukprot:Gregarina_sp_Pseudo_9__5943@NODE_95_length_4323_cov_28_595938_g87_i0_p2_GENE_NODE_95_length_4323_cov_28_595938_g87_i0NODE_95_length_4323_cov_28_595938_g87_i0_p2_ORF_typecomplete_len526_score128_22Glycos_transf_2/PF00535_26/0_11Glyco_tranf_2_3/PF13641_6/6_8e03Glyco_tranf_2_3/PF13641_6/0_4_NODE_95_length_4323_cov_28_595938_g87_i021423719
MIVCWWVCLAWAVSVAQRAYPFYPGWENEARTRPFDERVKELPAGWETPAWQAYTYTSPDPRATIVFDRDFARAAERNRRAQFRRLDKALVETGKQAEFEARVSEWVALFQRTRRLLSDRLGDLRRAPETQELTPRFSLAIPAIPGRLYRTLVLFEGLRCLTHLPRDMAMAITEPANWDEYVAYRGFWQLLPAFVSEELRPEFGVRVVTHNDRRYRQWGNRWMAANFTSPDAEWVTFFDNDDFPAPARWRWYDQIFSTRPEIDVFLAGKWWHKYPSLLDTFDNIAERTRHPQPAPENDTAVLAEALKYEADHGYNEPMHTMNSTWLSKWRVGSIVGAPLWVGKSYFIGQLYDATYEALNHTERYTADQLKTINEELDYLRAIDVKVPGGDWGDFWVHDGWTTIRRKLLDVIHPPTTAVWGEDSLYNWMIAASGFNYFHMVPPFYHMLGGVYVIWPKAGEELWRLEELLSPTTTPTPTPTTATDVTTTSTTTTPPTSTPPSSAAISMSALTAPSNEQPPQTQLLNA